MGVKAPGLTTHVSFRWHMRVGGGRLQMGPRRRQGCPKGPLKEDRYNSKGTSSRKRASSSRMGISSRKGANSSMGITSNKGTTRETVAALQKIQPEGACQQQSTNKGSKATSKQVWPPLGNLMVPTKGAHHLTTPQSVSDPKGIARSGKHSQDNQTPSQAVNTSIKYTDIEDSEDTDNQFTPVPGKRKHMSQEEDQKETLQLNVAEGIHRNQDHTENHEKTAEKDRRPPPIIITSHEHFLKTAKQIAQAINNNETLVYNRQGGRENTNSEEDFNKTMIIPKQGNILHYTFKPRTTVFTTVLRGFIPSKSEHELEELLKE
ncbi:hypothetical protein PR048_012711 [Dryococelus australis]|uniref:Uncharacterized protein n=1 Tax=Dryococelus australis TaxID=614101 RepID=A0ABQ9HQ51_9NEOP|nr:hypothetical protein PR048_012711 [Dryococelus australis]